MKPDIGHTIQWRRANGKMAQMRVDAIHEVDGERWLFSAVSPAGVFISVNQKFVLEVS
ncbi:MAG: hypothetical protein K2Y05_10495 [Hyphomicrobiaceae bacterium]|nr:hypothetical protein [Hyphomicrobiaceae bacterium]